MNQQELCSWPAGLSLAQLLHKTLAPKGRYCNDYDDEPPAGLADYAFPRFTASGRRASKLPVAACQRLWLMAFSGTQQAAPSSAH
jgi:hypothetical protein